MVLNGLFNDETILLKIIIIQTRFQNPHLFYHYFYPLSHNYITISFFSPTHLLEKAKPNNYFENTLSKFPPYLFLSQCPLKYFYLIDYKTPPCLQLFLPFSYTSEAK
jgi:hypothetical protein